jgi:hypothetical protein
MSFRIIVREVLDKDALNYCALSGAADKAALSAFVRGVKQLGLWESLVCWPLRSSQNAPNGNTQYSLGGLGTYNGTVHGGPTFTTDGMDFDGTDDFIATTFNPAFNNVTVFAAANTDNHNARRVFVAQRDNTTGLYGWELFSDAPPFGVVRNVTASAYDTSWRLSLAGQITDGEWQSVGLYWDKSFITGHRNSQTGAPVACSFLGSQNLRVGVGSNLWMDGKISAVVVVQNAGNVFAAVRDLYKSTLGTGLELP